MRNRDMNIDVLHGTIRSSFTIKGDKYLDKKDHYKQSDCIAKAVRETFDGYFSYMGWRRWGNTRTHVEAFDMHDKYMMAAFMRTQCSFQVDRSLDYELLDYNKALFWLRLAHLDRECELCFIKQEEWSWFGLSETPQVALFKDDPKSSKPWDIRTQVITQSIFEKHRTREYKIGTISEADDDMSLADLHNLYCMYLKMNAR